MLSIGGRREFILGLYTLPRVPDPWRQAQEAGFNLVRLRPNPEDFSSAQAHQLYGWVALGSVSPAKRDASEERIRKIVTAFKDHPALLFWETEDEPSFTWKKRDLRIPPSQIITTYRLVKALDPAHPLYLNHAPTNLVTTLQQYNDGADIVATDIYPVLPHGIRELYALWPNGRHGDLLNTYVSQVGQYADKMRRVAGPARAVFMVLQAFAWENLRKQDRDPAMVLYPTRAQLRFMAWQCVAHRVNGVIWWGLHTTPPEAPLWEDLKAVVRELAQWKRELAARPAPLAFSMSYHDTGHSLDRAIEWVAKPTPGGMLLVTVNADPNPVEVSFSGLDKFQRAEVLFESRSVTLSRGTLRDSFTPFDTHIYRLLAK